MIPLNSILANAELISKGPEIMVACCAVILLIAFFTGFAKGFKQVGWEWMTCLAAFVGFVFCDKYLKEHDLAIKGIPIPGMSETAVTTLILAFTCLAIMLLLYGLFCAAFRPRAVWQKKSRGQFKKEQASGTGDGNPEQLVWKNCAPPKLYGRFWGSIVCLVNTAVVLALIMAALLFFISATELATTEWGGLLKVKITDEALKYAKTYVMDFVTICIPFFVACYGYRRGFVGSVRTLLVKVGGLLVFIAAFGLPFMSEALQGNMNFIGKLVGRCTVLFGKAPEWSQAILGKLLAGVLLLMVFGLLFAFVDYLMAKFHTYIKNGNTIRLIDSVSACFLYFLLGVVMSVAMWALLYSLDAAGIFKISEVIGDDATIAKEMIGFVKTFLDPYIQPLIAAAL